jgi:hypothetical protein
MEFSGDWVLGSNGSNDIDVVTNTTYPPIHFYVINIISLKILCFDLSCNSDRCL